MNAQLRRQLPPGGRRGSCRRRLPLCGRKWRKAGTGRSRHCPGREVNLGGQVCQVVHQWRTDVGATRLQGVRGSFWTGKNCPSYTETAAGRSGLRWPSACPTTGTAWGPDWLRRGPRCSAMQAGRACPQMERLARRCPRSGWDSRLGARSPEVNPP